jgi:hypothetical protein
VPPRFHTGFTTLEVPSLSGCEVSTMADAGLLLLSLVFLGFSVWYVRAADRL